MKSLNGDIKDLPYHPDQIQEAIYQVSDWRYTVCNTENRLNIIKAEIEKIEKNIL